MEISGRAVSTERKSISVRVLTFARVRELIGVGELELTLPVGADAEACFEHLVELCAELAPLRHRLLVAVNECYSGWQEPLTDGDVVVFVPPVSGG